MHFRDISNVIQRSVAGGGRTTGGNFQRLFDSTASAYCIGRAERLNTLSTLPLMRALFCETITLILKMKSELDEVASENLKLWRTCFIHMAYLLCFLITGERPKWGMTLETNCCAWCNVRVAVRWFACGINAQQTKGRQKETQKSHPVAPNKKSFDEWRQKTGWTSRIDGSLDGIRRLKRTCVRVVCKK